MLDQQHEFKDLKFVNVWHYYVLPRLIKGYLFTSTQRSLMFVQLYLLRRTKSKKSFLGGLTIKKISTKISNYSSWREKEQNSQ